MGRFNVTREVQQVQDLAAELSSRGEIEKAQVENIIKQYDFGGKPLDLILQALLKLKQEPGTKTAGIRDELGIGHKTMCENCKMFTDDPVQMVGSKGLLNLCTQCARKIKQERDQLRLRFNKGDRPKMSFINT